MNASFRVREAMLSAGYARIRPVLMTAAAMILGMLPMALALGEGGNRTPRSVAPSSVASWCDGDDVVCANHRSCAGELPRITSGDCIRKRRKNC